MLSNITEEEAAAVVEVAEETDSYSMEEDEEAAAYVDVAVQDAEAVADAEEAAGVAAADGPTTAMSWTEYVVAYKRLSESEINFILSRQRKPFESTDLYKDMIADSSTTKEDLEHEAADHEYHEDGLSEMWERVRKEYAEKGFVTVDDDAIAERLELEQYYNQYLREKLSELNLDFGDD